MIWGIVIVIIIFFNNVFVVVELIVIHQLICPSIRSLKTAASEDQDGIGPQSLKAQMVFLNMSEPDAWHLHCYYVN